MRVQSLQERRGGIALLGDNVVQVNSAERDYCRCANWWSAQETTDNQSCEAPRGLARGLLGDRELDGVRQERVGVKETGQPVSVCLRVEQS